MTSCSLNTADVCSEYVVDFLPSASAVIGGAIAVTGVGFSWKAQWKQRMWLMKWGEWRIWMEKDLVTLVHTTTHMEAPSEVMGEDTVCKTWYDCISDLDHLLHIVYAIRSMVEPRLTKDKI